jgi:hypothetical protein
MGFKNASEITEFKRGMKIRYANVDHHIAYVNGGVAVSAHHFPIIDEFMHEMELDLDSVWEGQERQDAAGLTITITTLNNDMTKATYSCEGFHVLASVEHVRHNLPIVLRPTPDNDFKKCPACAVKTELCPSCLHNRAVIERLKGE